MQNEVVILRGVLEVKLTKYCTCAQGNSGELEHLSREWTGSLHIHVRTIYAKGIFREISGTPTCDARGGFGPHFCSLASLGAGTKLQGSQH